MGSWLNLSGSFDQTSLTREKRGKSRTVGVGLTPDWLSGKNVPLVDEKIDYSYPSYFLKGKRTQNL